MSGHGMAPVRGMGGSVITYRVGGREYPMVQNRNCKVCMSPYRMDIEHGLAGGRTYAKIIDHLPEGHELNTRNVKDHYLNGHLPLEVSASRQVVEERAKQVGKRIEDDSRSLVDGITLLESVVQKTFEGIVSGEIRPDVADGIRASRVLAALGAYDDGGMDQQAIVDAFMVYHEYAEANMSAEQFAKFGEDLAQNPVLAALARKYDGEDDGDVISGEVVPAGSQTEDS